MTMFLTFIFFVFGVISTASAASTAPKALNITTISANAQKESTLECWQLDAPLNASATPGTSGSLFAQLGKTGATSYGLIPAEFNGGLHNAPVVQWVAFIGGQAVISLPNSTQIASVPGGRRGLILAVDTANVSTLGHITNYPSSQETVALQIPTLNNQIPAHIILHDGPCKLEEQNQ